MLVRSLIAYFGGKELVASIALTPLLVSIWILSGAVRIIDTVREWRWTK